jgi:hypothetical protein
LSVVILLKNIRLLRTLFLLVVFILFLASCRNRKELSSTDTAGTPKKTENTSTSNYIVDKYATQLKVSPKDIDNIKLYTFVDEWFAALG